MEVQLWEGAVVEVCRDCAAERNGCWRGLKRRWLRRTMTKRGVT